LKADQSLFDFVYDFVAHRRQNSSSESKEAEDADEGDDLEIDDSYLFLQGHLSCEDSSSLLSRELKMRVRREAERVKDDEVEVVYRRN
jgi:hypothetical protein